MDELKVQKAFLKMLKPQLQKLEQSFEGKVAKLLVELHRKRQSIAKCEATIAALEAKKKSRSN